MPKDLEAIVVSHIQTVCPQEDPSLVITSETRLDELVMDSLELLELVFALESQFAIEADEKLMSELQTVGDIMAMVEQALDAEAA